MRGQRPVAHVARNVVTAGQAAWLTATALIPLAC
jgi:hypothetical protein